MLAGGDGHPVTGGSGGESAMRRYAKSGLVILLLSLLLLGGVTVHTVTQIQSYGKLINYVGIVRGATQRLVKLELVDQPDDGLVDYLDGILEDLSGADGEYHLPLPDDAVYRQALGELRGMWVQVKDHIDAHRTGAEDGEALLALSERYFAQANDTVFAAEAYTARQAKVLLAACAVMLSVMLATWLFIFWASSKKLFLLERTNRQLDDLARRDRLTGAYELDAFKEKAQSLLDQAGDTRYAVVYTDFADFKYINDMFGYAYGDKVLARYGEILRAGLREGELCGRVSADNFVLLLRYEQKEEVAARQREADREITAFMRSSPGRQSLSTCCGICCVGDVIEKLGIGGLMDRAGFARKTVKNKTNPNYVYYNDSIRRRLWEEKDIESRMAAALEHREFVVYYQPKVDLRTGRIASSEALVRWQLRDEVVPPDHFIPVFERKLMIGRLDQYVMEEVCRFLRERLDAGEIVLPVSVNVSRLQFYDEGFVSRYVEIRDKYRVPPELLEIEFTESIVFDNTDLLLQTVRALKQAGFACSIDDFGKGYSSLSLLKDLPVDTLKIDRFFFEEGEDQEREWAIIQGVVEMVHKFRVRTVAEGIETPEQVRRLQEIGCDYVQGFVFYRPMPREAYERALREQTAKSAEGRRPAELAAARAVLDREPGRGGLAQA